MTLPVDIVITRHGEAEHNVANKKSYHGDHSLFTDEFCARHPSQWRLTNLGRVQSESAGAWIKENIARAFDRYYVSSHVRTCETAGLMLMPNAQWYKTFMLREREWGPMEGISWEERRAHYADEIRRRKQHPFYWRPPGGESMADVCLRVDRVVQTMHRECEGQKVLIVCHGETMAAFRFVLERMDPEVYKRIALERDPKERMNNCQVVHYTRRNPETGEIDPYIKWRRSVCPWDEKLLPGVWEPVKRQRYSNSDLLRGAQRVPMMISE